MLEQNIVRQSCKDLNFWFSFSFAVGRGRRAGFSPILFSPHFMLTVDNFGYCTLTDPELLRYRFHLVAFLSHPQDAGFFFRAKIMLLHKNYFFSEI